MSHRFILVTCLFLFFYIAPSALWAKASQGNIQNDFTTDAKTLTSVRRSMEHTLQFSRSRTDIFNQPGAGQNNLLSRDQKLTLWGVWSNILDYTITLDGLRGGYGDFSSIKNKEDKDHAFSMAECAFMAQYRYAMEFIALADQNPDLDVVLNDAVPEMGLSSNTYKEFKFRFLNAARATEFVSFKMFEQKFGTGDKESKSACMDDSAMILKMGKTTGQVLTMKNALDIIKKGVFNAWFPAQKGVSSWMGDVRVRRGGTALISDEQIRSMIAGLKPGDILLERREWYLSNLGLPGFWTHAALIAGTNDERASYFDDPDVHKWVREQGVQSGDLNDLLRTRYPEAYSVACKKDDTSHLPRVLEAISEGVSFTAFEHTAAADSFVILRPRLSKVEKAIALLKGFQYSGRPYDFNFDFLTDSELVCSELVYKVYESGKDTAGLKFATENILGRTMTTPNWIACQFDEEYGKAGQQMDLVVFLDGYEKSGKAVDAGLDAFRTTWKRPKWHIVFQENPSPVVKTTER
jgi:hypothetical protein